MHVRTLPATLAATLGGALLAAPVAPAHAYAAPTILTPAPGDVAGVVDVTASTEAPYLLVQVTQPWAGSVWRSIEEVVATSAGTGGWAAPTYGFGANAKLVVAPCDTSARSSCHLAEATEAAMPVDNTVDQFQVPTLGDRHYPAYDPAIVVTVDDTDAGGLLTVRHGYRTVGDIVLGQPVQLAFDHPDYDRLSSGNLQVVRCSELDPDICTTEAIDPQNFTVRKGLRAYLATATSPRRISPNGDGVGEVIAFTISTLADTTEYTAAEWSLLTTDDQQVVAPQTMAIAADPGWSFAVAADPYAAGATGLAEGDYVIRTTLTGTEDGHEFSTTLDLGVYVDLTGPVVSVSSTYDTFYPAKDFYRKNKDYRNEVGFTLVVEPESGPGADTLAPEPKYAIVDAAGVRVDGTFNNSDTTARWDGGGTTLVPEGDYRLRVTARDAVGNESVTFSEPVTVSHDHYARKTKKKMVTARGSLFRNWSGRCGLLRKPGLKGGRKSLGYYSNGRCKTTTVSRGVAEGVHRLRLPRADWYRTLRFRVDGGPVKRSHRAGFLTFSNQNTALGKLKPLASSWGWHLKETRKGDQMIWSDGSVYWLVNTGYGQRYDVRRFEVWMEYADWTGDPGSEPYAPQVSGRVGRGSALEVQHHVTPVG